MLLILKKEQIESSKLRALAQAIVDKEKGPEAFDSFRKSAFPWVETQKKRDVAEHVRLLEQEVKRGALGVTPLVDPTRKVRSRMKTRVIESDEKRRNVASTPEMRKIYSKMGSLIQR